jgi:dolichol-phosphate mannosyltransferase
VAGYVAVSVGLAAPWFIAVALRDETFLAYFFWFHHVQRFVEPFDHVEPFWFYLPELLIGMLPWTLLLPGLIVALGRRKSEMRSLRFFLFAGLCCVGFFSLAGCKRGFYVLPAVPPLAIALGCYLDLVLSDTPLSKWMALARHRSRLAFCSMLLVIIGAVTGSIAGTTCGIIGNGGGAMLGALAGAGSIVAVGIGVRHGGRASWIETGIAMTMFMLAAVFVFLPAYAEKFSLRDELRCNAAHGFPDGPILCYPRGWDSINFYLGRDDVRAFRVNELDEMMKELAERPGAVVVARTGFEGAVKQRLPVSAVWEPLGRPGHLTMGRVRAVKQESQTPASRRVQPGGGG